MRAIVAAYAALSSSTSGLRKVLDGVRKVHSNDHTPISNTATGVLALEVV